MASRKASLKVSDWRQFLKDTFHIDFPRLEKARYQGLVTTDIINIILVMYGGRDFCLLENNSQNQAVREEKISFYKALLSHLGLSWRFDGTRKKSMLVWSPQNPAALRNMNHSMGEKLGYLDPQVELSQNWEELTLKKRGSIGITEARTGLQLFGQNVFDESVTDLKVERYCRDILKRLNIVLKKFDLLAVAEYSKSQS